MNFFDFYYRQIVTEAEMDQAFEWVEDAMWLLATDNALSGIHSASTPAQHGTGDLTVDVPGPFIANGKDGERIYNGASNTNIDCSVDEYGVSTAVAGAPNSKIMSLFARFKRNPQEPKTDGNGATVYTEQLEDMEFFVRQGAETSGIPVPPPILSDAVLLCDITMVFAQTQIVTSDINTDRAEAWLNDRSGTTITLFEEGNAKDAITQLFTWFDQHISDTAFPHGGGSISFSFSEDWFGSVAPAGPAPPPATAAAALDAIVYDLAQATGSALVGTPDVSLTYVGWTGVPIAGALSALATAIDGHIGGALPRHPATAITTTTTGWLSAANVQAMFAEVVTDLGSQVDGAEGASRVGFSTHSYLGSGDLQATIEALVDALAKTSTTTGAARIGIDALSTTGGVSWGFTPAEVRAALIGIMDAYANNVGTSDGASKIGFEDTGPTPSNVRAKLLALETEIDGKLSKTGIDAAAGPIAVVGNLLNAKPILAQWPPASNADRIARKDFFTAGADAGAYPYRDANVYTAPSSYQFRDVCVTQYDAGDGLGTRSFPVALYSTGPTGDNHLVMVDPRDGSAVIDTTVYASAGVFGAALAESSGSFFVLYSDDTFRKYTITTGAFVEDTSASWPVTFAASAVAGDTSDRLICVDSDIIVACGGLATNVATGPFFRYDKNGVQQTEGFGSTLVGTATETPDGGLACDGTDIYASVWDTGTNSGRIVAIDKTAMGTDGVNGPWVGSGNSRCKELLFDGWNLWAPFRLSDGTTNVRLSIVNDPGGTPTFNPTEFQASVTGGTVYKSHPLHLAFDGTNVWMQVEDDDTTDYLHLEKFPAARWDGKNNNKVAAAQILAVDGWVCASASPARMACDGAFIYYGAELGSRDMLRLPNPATR